MTVALRPLVGARLVDSAIYDHNEEAPNRWRYPPAWHHQPEVLVPYELNGTVISPHSETSYSRHIIFKCSGPLRGVRGAEVPNELHIFMKCKEYIERMLSLPVSWDAHRDSTCQVVQGMLLVDEIMRLIPDNTMNGAMREDDYNLGHFFMDYMTKFPEDCVWQIDAGTGETESKLSVKSRSIRLARCLRNAGLRPGDVAVVAGRNHLDVHIPFYAAYMNGLPLAGLDPMYKYEEIKFHFDTTKPKIVFCELDNFGDMQRAARDLGLLDTKILTFGDGDHSLAKFLKMYDDDAPEHMFKVAKFDTNKVFAWLVSTSGTSGLPKVAAFKHPTIIKILQLYVLLKEKKVQPALNLSSVQWISSYLASLAMITANHIKVQTSSPITIEHAIDIINKYRPVASTGSPSLFTGIAQHPKVCDLTSFNTIVVTGSCINQDILQQLRSRMRPEAEIWNLFAQTECVGPILLPSPNGPAGNAGKELELVKVQLVDVKTGEVIKEPNKTGELWSKGPRFSEYYNNPEATARAFTPDGWYKTGDLLYRDANGYYFFVDRMTNAFKVRGYYVTPMEVEKVIQEHPGVIEACVVGVPHAEDGYRVVAVVQRCPKAAVSERDIQEFAASKLSIHKHLHGGVIFVDSFPRTVTGKVQRAKVLEIVLRAYNVSDSDVPCVGNTKKLISTFQQLSESTNSSKYVSVGRR